MSNPINLRKQALSDLARNLDLAIQLSSDEQMMREMTSKERDEFRSNHPGAHFVIGDFEIKCLNPEKYELYH